MPKITTSYESARGCGNRKKGGLYLVGGSVGSPCGFLPVILETCQCCGMGYKFSRTPTWVSTQIFGDKKSCHFDVKKCVKCWLPNTIKKDDKMLLLWIGKAFYKTPTDFLEEVKEMGISRRIKHIPKGLVVGETVILLAHLRHSINEEKSELENKAVYNKAIFSAFIPRAIQYIVKGTESEKELEDLESRGIELINVVPVEASKHALN